MNIKLHRVQGGAASAEPCTSPRSSTTAFEQHYGPVPQRAREQAREQAVQRHLDPLLLVDQHGRHASHDAIG